MDLVKLSIRQPVSTFGRLDRAELTADMIIWPCKRLGVPAAFVRQWMENAGPKLLLSTLMPQGGAELSAVYERVLRAFGVEPEGDPFLAQPRFV